MKGYDAWLQNDPGMDAVFQELAYDLLGSERVKKDILPKVLKGCDVDDPVHSEHTYLILYFEEGEQSRRVKMLLETDLFERYDGGGEDSLEEIEEAVVEFLREGSRQ